MSYEKGRIGRVIDVIKCTLMDKQKGIVPRFMQAITLVVGIGTLGLLAIIVVVTATVVILYTAVIASFKGELFSMSMEKDGTTYLWKRKTTTQEDTGRTERLKQSPNIIDLNSRR